MTITGSATSVGRSLAVMSTGKTRRQLTANLMLDVAYQMTAPRAAVDSINDNLQAFGQAFSTDLTSAVAEDAALADAGFTVGVVVTPEPATTAGSDDTSGATQLISVHALLFFCVLWHAMGYNMVDHNRF